MKLYTATTITDGESAIEIQKNDGRHVQWVSAHCFDTALNQRGAIVIVESCGKRYGFGRNQIESFLKDNSIGGGNH